ncbi:hypothetical protein AOT83_20935 [Mycobacteroides sp. H001]|uniref:hypothetical protein n=1 Tax=Mycobacteroides TaxID=670516 RepID=UPI000715A2EF|nr:MULTISPECIES: hypothetical protein [Mycobacteroides]KRQ20790.1 hypothetical protein AOT86_21900 [Mycobacteroides sp. H072]KRQ52946.1 hypothetical protein AOT85_07955 [Mycobacteroides sp. H054]KRQ66972.1 hypothetical protein AOT83_20935 [Mycobacteroides sp. H001]OHU36414.1 hypothetical protein BKG79_19490 [Mycobacteroides chelonae]
METLGIWMQVVGAIITGLGLVYVWYRVSERFRQWRKTIRNSFRFEIPQPLAKLSGDIVITPQPASFTLTGHTPRVKIVSTDPDERLENIENALADLDALIDDRAKAVIDTEIAKLEKDSKFFALRDIICALGGFIIATTGLVFENWATLVSSFCQYF